MKEMDRKKPSHKIEVRVCMAQNNITRPREWAKEPLW